MTVTVPRRPNGRTRAAGARARVYEGFLAFSALTTVGIGVRAQLSFDDFQTVAYGPVQQRRVQAYADVLKATEPLASQSFANVAPEKARKAARLWLEKRDSGDLKPLEPVAFEDDVNVPVKSEILRTNLSLSIYLNQLADHELDTRKWTLAASDALLSYRLANVIKYSDFDAISQLGMTQRKSLRIIDDSMARLDRAQRRKIAQDLVETRKDRTPLSHLAFLGRTQYLDFLERQQIPVPEATLRAQVHYADAVQPGERASVPTSGLKLGALADDPVCREFLSSMQFAYKTESNLAVQEAGILKQVDHPVLRIVKREDAPKPPKPFFGPVLYSRIPYGPAMSRKFMMMYMERLRPMSATARVTASAE